MNNVLGKILLYVAPLLLLLGLGASFGVSQATDDDHERRIGKTERQVETLIPAQVRIETNIGHIQTTQEQLAADIRALVNRFSSPPMP